MSDGILVVTEYADKRFRKSTYEVVSEGRRLADQLNTSLSAVVLGSDVLAAAAELKHYGADRVLVCDAPELADFDSDRFTPILFDIVTTRQPKIVLFSASIRDKQLATRLAAKLHAGLAMECTGLAVEGENLIATRSMYGSKLIAKVALEGAPQIAALRPNVFPAATVEKAGEIERIQVKLAPSRIRLIEKKQSVAKLDLTEADVVVSGGRGMGGRGLQCARDTGRFAGRGGGRNPQRSGRGLAAACRSGGTDREGRVTQAVRGLRDFGRHSAHCRHEFIRLHRGHQQGPRCTHFPVCRLRDRGQPVRVGARHRSEN